MKDKSTDNQPEPQDRSPDAVLEAFESEIHKQEDLLYGIALYFEGLSLLFSGQDAVIETYRNQFWNIIQVGNAAGERARALLQEARRDSSKVKLVERFRFSPGQGHPQREELVKRAQTLVETYNALYPERPRDRALGEDETLRLIETASERFPEAFAINGDG